MKVLRFLGTVWGWLAIALITAAWALTILIGRENERTDFNLRVWNGIEATQKPHP
jgi:hypothetical protein